MEKIMYRIKRSNLNSAATRNSTKKSIKPVLSRISKNSQLLKRTLEKRLRIAKSISYSTNCFESFFFFNLVICLFHSQWRVVPGMSEWFGLSCSNRSERFLYEFSAMMMPLSTITPMASAMPVSDMILEEIPKAFRRIKLAAIVIGI